MRIVGGTYRGRIFKPNKKFNARPTTDIAKEALFNILSNRFDFSELKVLDLFAGTGSIGYEFVSRGCAEATFVEKDFNHYKFILEVLETLKIENAKVFKADVFSFLKLNRNSFDIVFADPPYDLKFLNEIPDAVLNSKVLKSNGVLILEHSKDNNFSQHKNFKEIRNYGKVNFSFFEK